MSLESGLALSFEESLSQRLVGSGGGPKTKARDHSGGLDGGEQRESLVNQPRLLDQPMSARPASHPYPRRLASRTGIAEVSRAW